MHHELLYQGCYGFSRFSTWAFRQAQAREAALRGMSPRDAENAQRLAAEFMRREVPAIRRAIGCD